MSKIEWTEKTWNPITGCSKISEGCKNCYAEKMAMRLQAMGQPKYKDGFKVTLHPQVLSEPLKWKKSQMVFVCSMSDIFHDEVPDEFIFKVFEIMNKAHWHIFQVLTKRPERFSSILDKLLLSNNIWLGVTIESQNHIDRLPKLISTKADVKFLSLEPLLSDITIPENQLSKIDWVIVGGESGTGSRAIQEDWLRNIRDQCVNLNVPFFFKQWGGVNKKKNGRLLDGKIWDEYPKNGKRK